MADVGIGLISGKEVSFHYYQQFHHLLLHGWPAALAVAALLTCFARKRARVATFGLLAFHLHLFCDLIGSRGPAPSDLGPIGYGEPFFSDPIWIWKGQWRLDGGQNQTIFPVLFVLALWQAAKLGYSFVKVISQRLDSICVGVLHKWYDRHQVPKVTD